MPKPPTIGQRLKRSISAFRQMFFAPHPGSLFDRMWYGGAAGGVPHGAAYDFARAMGDATRNVSVAACLRVIRDNAAQPRMVVTEEQHDGDRQPVKDAPVVRLWHDGNRFCDYFENIGLGTTSTFVDGNGIYLKVRSPAGIPIELWNVPPWTMEPKWPVGDPTVYISHWEYNPGGGKIYIVDPADVIHIRYGEPDPRNNRLAISPLKAAAARTICSLNECDAFTALIMKHGGVPPVVIMPVPGPDAQYPDEDEAQGLARGYRRRLDGDRWGEPFVPTAPVEVKMLGYSPQQLALDSIPARLEDQICALLGVPAMLVGLTSGASHKTYNNIYEARRSFYEETLIPFQARFAAAVWRSLKDDPGMGDLASQELGFDYTGIQCLQEDQDKKAARVAMLYDGGLYTRARALRELGQDATDADEVFMIKYGTQFATPDQLPKLTPELAPQPKPKDEPGEGDAGAKALTALAPLKALAAMKPPFAPEPVAPPESTLGTKAIEEDDDLAAAREYLRIAADDANLTLSEASGDEDRRRVLTALVAIAEEEMRREAAALRAELAGDPEAESKSLADDAAAKVKAWKDRAAKFLRRVFLAGALTLTDPMTKGDMAAFDEAHKAQVDFLDNFAAQIIAGEQETDTDGLVSRAASYGAATWQIAVNVGRNHTIDAGQVKEERRVLGTTAHAHCDDCLAEESKGWVNLGELLPLGDSICHSRCVCSFEYR